jgi:hypothetical protein
MSRQQPEESARAFSRPYSPTTDCPKSVASFCSGDRYSTSFENEGLELHCKLSKAVRRPPGVEKSNNTDNTDPYRVPVSNEAPFRDTSTSSTSNDGGVMTAPC